MLLELGVARVSQGLRVKRLWWHVTKLVISNHTLHRSNRTGATALGDSGTDYAGPLRRLGCHSTTWSERYWDSWCYAETGTRKAVSRPDVCIVWSYLRDNIFTIIGLGPVNSLSETAQKWSSLIKVRFPSALYLVLTCSSDDHRFPWNISIAIIGFGV